MDDIKAPKRPDEPVVIKPGSQPSYGAVGPDAAPTTAPTPVQTNDPTVPLPQPIDPVDLHIEPSKRKRKTKKKLLIVILICVLALGGAAAAWYFFVRKDAKPATVETKTTEVKVVEKKTYYASLTGNEVADETAVTQQVTGVMIENSPQARPQSGLTEAGVVVEAIAEGGITRFAAFYQDTTATSIGPVRSARPYYVNFALGFDASYAHVGGSPDALSDIRTLGVKDMDQFFNAGAYERITSRYAPHNVYTSSQKLRALEQSKGYTKSAFTPPERKQDVPQTPTATVIDLSISSPLYSPRFTYDPTTNSYGRSQGGSPHVDSQGKQIVSKSVVVLITPQGLDTDGSHTTYQTVGSGKLYVFQDGIVSEGTWSKADRKASLQLIDKNGLPMKLNRGQTWVSLVGQTSDVSYKP